MDSTFLMFASVMLAIFIGGIVVYKKSSERGRITYWPKSTGGECRASISSDGM